VLLTYADVKARHIGGFAPGKLAEMLAAGRMGILNGPAALAAKESVYRSTSFFATAPRARFLIDGGSIPSASKRLAS
jgi:hypothetical protein